MRPRRQLPGCHVRDRAGPLCAPPPVRRRAGAGCAPRLSPPLRLLRDNRTLSGQASGKSGILFPMMDPHGVHSFPAPSPDLAFDLGSLLVNQTMRYLATGGQSLDFDPCQLKWSCPWIAPPPH